MKILGDGIWNAGILECWNWRCWDGGTCDVGWGMLKADSCLLTPDYCLLTPDYCLLTPDS